MAVVNVRMTPRPAAVAVVSMAIIACIPVALERPDPSPVAPSGSPHVAVTTASRSAGPSGRPSFVRPTPTPLPTFLAYVVKRGDTLTSIARAHGTTARSIAFWNRSQHPSLDPDSPNYSPNRIEVGWVLLLVPDLELDPEDLPPEPTPSSSPTQYPDPYG
jgi:LysM domain